MYKSIRVIALFFLMLVWTAGCGQSGKSVQTSGETVKGQGGSQKSILVYSGAGLRKPIDELGKAFEQSTGVIVQFTYAGSAQCTSQILTTGKGDVIVPGDIEELKPLLEKDKVTAHKSVVLHIPVLAVPAGNPAGIAKLEDLGKPNVKVALGDSKANPIGKLSDKILADRGLLEKVEKNVVARAATVNELLVYLAMKQADAAIIWEDNLQGNDKVELLKAPDIEKHIKTIPVATLKCSADPETAAKFAEFISSTEGLKVWEKWGFKPIPGGK